jgi:hypothetical protein
LQVSAGAHAFRAAFAPAIAFGQTKVTRALRMCDAKRCKAVFEPSPLSDRALSFGQTKATEAWRRRDRLVNCLGALPL